MKLASFRIKNFRSILDSGWVPFSPDCITVLVGQNESGKSSVLEALFSALTDEEPTADDLRIGAPLPSVQLRVQLSDKSVDSYIGDLAAYQITGFKKYLQATNELVELTCQWEWQTSEGKKSLAKHLKINDKRLGEEMEKAKNLAPEESEDEVDKEQVAPELASSSTLGSPPMETTENDIGHELWRALPLGVLFNEASGQLPSQVDIDEKGQPTGSGARAALNFLQIADIDLPELLRGDRRARENILNKANSRVSENFNSFWSQTIGKSGRLTLKCDVDHYGTEHPEKAGKPHLVFWICDGNTQLYPKQRSQGVRWFLSFYLQLKASEKSKYRRVFLLDEPGANLHSKAQADVLKLINQLGKETSSVVYSTHSPQMVEYPKLFRVHAVQRDGELDESPTRIIDAHRLGTASTDTLSPVLTAMGADLSQHQVVRKSHNVLLEEMSGYYYLSSFWKLFSVKTEAHFIAATGVNKIEALANMFRGWGLDFIVAIDDDKQGREAYNSMKRELFGDDAELADRRMIKMPGCPTIEDAFSKEDFAKLVLKDAEVEISGTNAEFLKAASRSKPVLAYNFALAVADGDITLSSLSEESKERVKNIVEAIRARLTAK